MKKELKGFNSGYNSTLHMHRAQCRIITKCKLSIFCGNYIIFHWTVINFDFWQSGKSHFKKKSIQIGSKMRNGIHGKKNSGYF